MHEIIPDGSGRIERDGQFYEDNQKTRAFIEIGDAIRDSLPVISEENIRLWRGNRKEEVGHNPSYTNSLDGIALPFLFDYNGVLSYIEISKKDAEKYLVEAGAAAGSEFILPKKVLKNIKIVGFTENEEMELKAKTKPLSREEKPGWDKI
jgi:hypothetical protein